MATWLGLVVFFILTLFSAGFRVVFGFETQKEKMDRVLGVEDKSVSLD